jgi:DNA-binding beta-propeller fold protein YncE
MKIKEMVISIRNRSRYFICLLVLIIIITGFFINYFISKPKSPDTYEFKLKWGSKGSNEIQFTSLSGLIIDRKGNVYVADKENYCIKKFDFCGRFITKCGNKGSGDEQFKNIYKFAVDPWGNIYVIDNMTEIKKFNSEAKFIKKWSSEKDRFKCISVNSLGYVFTVNSIDYLKVFTSNGNLLFTHRISNIKKIPYINREVKDMVIDSRGYCYLVEYLQREITRPLSLGVASEVDGKLVPYYSASPTGEVSYKSVIRNLGFFGLTSSVCSNYEVKGCNEYIGVTIDSNGYIYIAVPSENCIKKFDSSGKIITQFGSKGSGDGQFNNPTGVAVDKEGNVYVMDTGNHRIQKFTPKD